MARWEWRRKQPRNQTARNQKVVDTTAGGNPRRAAAYDKGNLGTGRTGPQPGEGGGRGRATVEGSCESAWKQRAHARFCAD